MTDVPGLFEVVKARLQTAGGELTVHTVERRGSTQAAMAATAFVAPVLLGIAAFVFWLGGPGRGITVAIISCGAALIATSETLRARLIRHRSLHVRKGCLLLRGRRGEERVSLAGFVRAEVCGRFVLVQTGQGEWLLGFGLDSDALETLARAIRSAARVPCRGTAPEGLDRLRGCAAQNRARTPGPAIATAAAPPSTTVVEAIQNAVGSR